MQFFCKNWPEDTSPWLVTSLRTWWPTWCFSPEWLIHQDIRNMIPDCRRCSASIGWTTKQWLGTCEPQKCLSSLLPLKYMPIFYFYFLQKQQSDTHKTNQYQCLYPKTIQQIRIIILPEIWNFCLHLTRTLPLCLWCLKTGTTKVCSDGKWMVSPLIAFIGENVHLNTPTVVQFDKSTFKLGCR